MKYFYNKHSKGCKYKIFKKNHYCVFIHQKYFYNNFFQKGRGLIRREIQILVTSWREIQILDADWLIYRSRGRGGLRGLAEMLACEWLPVEGAESSTVPTILADTYYTTDDLT